MDADKEAERFVKKFDEEMRPVNRRRLVRLVLLVLAALCAALYLVWSVYRKPAPAAGTVVQASPAVAAAKVTGPILKVPLKVVPKRAVEKQFEGLGTIPSGEEVVDTADIPAEAAENGVQTITFMNLTTGVATTSYLAKPAPWFALEHKNTFGAGYRLSTEGARIPVYYRRDIARVKDLHLVGELGAQIPLQGGKAEGHAGAMIEWRW